MLLNDTTTTPAPPQLGATTTNTSSPAVKFDYFFDFPDDYELGDGGEFDLDGIISTVPGLPWSLPPPLLVTPDLSAPPSNLFQELFQEQQLNVYNRFPGIVRSSSSNSFVIPPMSVIPPPPPPPPVPIAPMPLINGKRHMDVHDDNKTYASLMERRHAAEAVEREKRIRASGYSNGKNRLKLEFLDLGGPGTRKQGFGRKNGAIPDGLHGTNEVYSEKWEFQIFHRIDRETNTVCLEWIIINGTSRHVTARTETPHEAHVRRTQGKTICNHVVREALEQRASELENSINVLGAHPLRAANLQSRAKALRPRRCLIGLLFFGLIHEAVQDNMAIYYGVEDADSSSGGDKLSHDDEFDEDE
jgi:hypothetical protein